MKQRIVVWLIGLSVAISVILIGQRTITSYVDQRVGTALQPVSDDISKLNESLLVFEKDLTDLKAAESVSTQTPTTTATVSTAKTPTVAVDTAPAASTDSLISINTASLGQLESLPGIGASYAQRIIEGRPYRSIDELNRVKGVGSKTIEKLRPLVSL